MSSFSQSMSSHTNQLNQKSTQIESMESLFARFGAVHGVGLLCPFALVYK